MKRTALGMALLLASAVTSRAETASDQEEIAQIERDFASLQISKDPLLLARVAARMDPGFRFIDPASADAGASKTELLALITSDKLVVQSMEFRPFTIRVFGTTAIVEGVNTGRASFGGADVSGSFSWVDVFEKKAGRWTWLYSQSGKIGDKLSDRETCSRPPPCPATHPGFVVSR
jgi:hypothetical protein